LIAVLEAIALILGNLPIILLLTDVTQKLSY
jgi:hypothetical protein